MSCPGVVDLKIGNMSYKISVLEDVITKIASPGEASVVVGVERVAASDNPSSSQVKDLLNNLAVFNCIRPSSFNSKVDEVATTFSGNTIKMPDIRHSKATCPEMPAVRHSKANGLKMPTVRHSKVNGGVKDG